MLATKSVASPSPPSTAQPIPSRNGSRNAAAPMLNSSIIAMPAADSGSACIASVAASTSVATPISAWVRMRPLRPLRNRRMAATR